MKVENIIYLLTLRGYNYRWYIPSDLPEETDEDFEKKSAFSQLTFLELEAHILKKEFWEAMAKLYGWQQWEDDMILFMKRHVFEGRSIPDLLVRIDELNKHKAI